MNQRSSRPDVNRVGSRPKLSAPTHSQPTVSERIYKPSTETLVSDAQLNEGKRILNLYRLAKLNEEETKLKEKEAALKEQFQKLASKTVDCKEQEKMLNERKQAMRRYFALTEYLELSEKIKSFLQTYFEPNLLQKISLSEKNFEELKKLLACLRVVVYDEQESNDSVHSTIEEMISMLQSTENGSGRGRDQPMIDRTRDLMKKSDEMAKVIEEKTQRISKMRAALERESRR